MSQHRLNLLDEAQAAVASLDEKRADTTLAQLQVAPVSRREQLAMALCKLVLGRSDGTIVPYASPASAEEAFEDGLLRTLLADRAGGDEALRSARRMIRIARSDEHAEGVLIGGVLLARQRRLAGFPHLARRILGKLGDLTQNRWSAWAAWEQLMAGGNAPAAFDPIPGAWGWVQSLRAFLDTLHWTNPLPTLHAWSSDVVRLGASFGNGTTSELSSWCTGMVHELPFGLSILAEVGPEEANAWVEVDGAGTARRRLRRGPPPPNLVVPDTPRAQSALAALLLRTGQTLSTTEFFVQVYGFEFVHSRHRATLNQLVRRVRQALPASVELVRDDGLRLQVQGAVSTVDPRSRAKVEDRLLGAIAKGNSVSAREVADELGIPLRTVQRSLRQLVDSGACQAEGAGASIRYSVEDTTFTSPLVRAP